MRRRLCVLLVGFVVFFSSASYSFPYKTVEESYKKGLSWGGKKSVKKMKRIFALFYPTFWRYGGGRDAAWLSFLAMTETAHTGNPYTSTKDTNLGESGLLSVKRQMAKKYGIDACDKNANVYAKCKYHHDKTKWIDEKYGGKKFYQRMDYADRYLLYALYGKSSCFRVQSKAIATAMTAKGFPFNHPWFVALDWIKSMGEKLWEPQFDHCWGRTNAVISTFRFTRAKAMRDLMIRVYGGGKKGRERWEKCVRPISLLDKPPKNKGYPGDKLHGQCCSDMKPSAHGKSCWERWRKPPTFKYKGKGKKKKYQWEEWCPDHDCEYEEVYEAWFDKMQEAGTLPSDEIYEQVKSEMQKDGCWIL